MLQATSHTRFTSGRDTSTDAHEQYAEKQDTGLGVFTVLARRGMNGSLVFGSRSKTSKSTLHVHQRPGFVGARPRSALETPVQTAGMHPAAPPGAANTASVPPDNSEVRCRRLAARLHGGAIALLRTAPGACGPPCMRSCLCPFAPRAGRQLPGGGLNVARILAMTSRKTRGRRSCGIARFCRCCAAACCLVPYDVDGGLAALAPILHRPDSSRVSIEVGFCR